MNNTFSKTAIALSESSMEDASTKIKTATEEIKVALDTIKAEIDGISNVWQDKNAQVYMEKIQQLQQGFPGFYNHAYALGSFLDGVVNAYRENVLNPTTRAVNGEPRNL